jgi:hypothetical protein
MISAQPVPGEPGHYTLNFPLRPGATKFAFNYDAPYSGRAAFQTRRAYSVLQLAVMIPAAMKFSSRSSGLSGSSGFETLPVGNRDFQVHAVNRLHAGKGPEFEISGTGAFSFPEAQAKSNTGLQSAPAPKPAASAGARFILHSPASFDSGLQRPKPSSQLLVLLALTGGLVHLHFPSLARYQQQAAQALGQVARRQRPQYQALAFALTFALAFIRIAIPACKRLLRAEIPQLFTSLNPGRA